MTKSRGETRPYEEVVALFADLPRWLTSSALVGQRIRVARGVRRGEVRPVDVTRLREVLVRDAAGFACTAANRTRWGEPHNANVAFDMMIDTMTALVRLDTAYPPPAPAEETHHETSELHHESPQGDGDYDGEVLDPLWTLLTEALADEPLAA